MRPQAAKVESGAIDDDRVGPEPFKYDLSRADLLWTFSACGLVLLTFIALPYFAMLSGHYFLRSYSHWMDPLFFAIISSVIIGAATRTVFLRDFVFWMSLIISSAILFISAHAWSQRVHGFRHSEGKLVGLIGFVLFFVVYRFVRFLQKQLHSEQLSDRS
jgi:hypothetical protein